MLQKSKGRYLINFYLFFTYINVLTVVSPVLSGVLLRWQESASKHNCTSSLLAFLEHYKPTAVTIIYCWKRMKKDEVFITLPHLKFLLTSIIAWWRPPDQRQQSSPRRPNNLDCTATAERQTMSQQRPKTSWQRQSTSWQRDSPNLSLWYPCDTWILLIALSLRQG